MRIAHEILDEGLDELAVSAHASFLPRVLIGLIVAGVFSTILPWQICIAWGLATLVLEIQAWFATRKQFLGRSVGLGTRIWHATGLALSSLLWVGMGALLWTSRSVDGALCATILWLSVILFAQTNAYQSPTGFVIGGAMPGALVLAIVVFAPHEAHVRLVPVAATLLIGLMFAGDGVRRMLVARRRLNETQANLRESEMKYRLLAERSPDILVKYDLQGRIEYVSAAVRNYGYEPDDFIGLNYSEILHPSERQRNTEFLAALAAGSPLPQRDQSVWRVRNAAGEWVSLEGATSPLVDDDGRVTGAMAAMRDVTERVVLEDELRRKRSEAEAATLAKSEFLANMSHEIRTPLTAIVGFAGLLDVVENLPSTARAYCSRIATAGQTLLSVVNDILDYSKIEEGHLELDPQPFDPVALVTETVDLVRAQAELKGLELGVEVQGLLPAAVSADSSRLRQVLLNLLSNAIKFTQRGGVTVKVEYSHHNKGTLHITVSDTGVGLDADQIRKIFHRFSQADNSISRHYGGTGLGLSICKSLTELMGGSIGVDSVPGEGSTFWFAIDAPEAEFLTALTTDSSRSDNTRPAYILLVDDIAVNRELVKAMLSVFNHGVTEASNGTEAVEHAMHTPFDLILMDLQMPGMDGLAAARAIRATSAINATTPIIALSANVMENHVQACRQAGMNDHIGKPIDPGELLSKVAYWSTEPEPRGALGPPERRRGPHP